MRCWILALAFLAIPSQAHATAPKPEKPPQTSPIYPDPSSWTPEMRLEADLQARIFLARYYAKNKDILNWGRAVMPGKFTRPSCRELHGYFVDIRHAELTSTVAPRGHAKTFVKCCVIPIFQALEEPDIFDFYLNVQSTHSKGAAVNFAIKNEIENNAVIRRIYGDQIGSVKWTDELFMLKNGVVFQGAGAGDSIRGMQFLNRRPKYEIVDDLYDEEDIDAPERIKAKNEWFWGSLYPTRARGPGTSFQVQGTVAGSNDLMLELGKMAVTDKGILHREFSAYDPATGKVLWEELNSLETLQQERERMGSIIFDRELQGIRRNQEDAIIKDHYLENWEYDPSIVWANIPRDFGAQAERKIVGARLGCDPSTGEKEAGDPAGFAIVVVTIGPGSRRDYYIESLANESLSFDARLSKLESMAAQYHSRLIDPSFRIRRAFIEAIGGFIDWGEQAKKRTGLPVELVKFVKGKIANLAACSGYFEFGKVHCSSAIDKKLRDTLVEQLTSNYPSHDDLRDAVLLCLRDSTTDMKSWV
jgi:hypothetical protein